MAAGAEAGEVIFLNYSYVLRFYKTVDRKYNQCAFVAGKAFMVASRIVAGF